MFDVNLKSFLLLVCLTTTNVAFAQSRADTKQSPDEHTKSVAHVYEKTQSAKTASDYSEVIDLAEKALKLEELSQNNREYLHSLLAWAHDHRGFLRFELIELLRNANNAEQADIAVEKTFDDFDTAIKLNAKRWQTKLHRGMLYAINQDWQKAITDFSAVIELDKSQNCAYFNRAECLYQTGQFELALQDYEYGLQASPGDLQVITGRAHTLLQLNQIEKAVEDYNVVIGMKPDDPWSFANRGDAHQKAGNWNQAYKDYNKALELQPEADVYRRLAWMLATCPDEEFYRPQTAIELARKSIDMAGKNSARLDVLAACLASSGYFDDAKEMQQEALKIASESESKSLQQRMAMYEKGEAFLQSKKR